MDYVSQEPWHETLYARKGKEASEPPPTSHRRGRPNPKGKAKDRRRAAEPPPTQTSPAPPFAVVLHAVLTGFALGDLHQWLEQDIRHLSIGTARWLRTKYRRVGKTRSSVVLYLEDPTIKTSQRLGRETLCTTTYDWDR